MIMMDLVRRLNCYVPSQFGLTFETEFIDQRFLYTPVYMTLCVWITFLIMLVVIMIYPKQSYENYKRVSFLFRKN